MNQINFENDIIKFNIKKAPFVIRAVFFLFAFAFFIFPIIGMITSLTLGNSFKISFLIGIGVFSLLGFYLLRIALWNTYGQETIKKNNNHLIYEADYRWFRDGKKVIDIENIEYSILPIGYEEENNGVLILDNGKNKIECSIKIPKPELEELILKIKTATNSRFT